MRCAQVGALQMDDVVDTDGEEECLLMNSELMHIIVKLLLVVDKNLEVMFKLVIIYGARITGKIAVKSSWLWRVLQELGELLGQKMVVKNSGAEFGV